MKGIQRDIVRTGNEEKSLMFMVGDANGTTMLRGCTGNDEWSY